MDYPQGDGRKDCPDCKGRGVLPVPKTPSDPTERTRPCNCVYARDVAMNIERGWRGLLASDPVPNSPLRARVKSNLRVTGGRNIFRAHLKHVAARQPPNWGFLVVTDADLMDAWLSRKLDVKDADVVMLREQADIHRYDALVDLIEPPALLVLVCGVKAARNEAMPEVFLEALRHREHLSKPTWVVDQPSYPLGDGHISYSYAVGDFLSEWPRVKLQGSAAPVEEPSNNTPAPARRPPVTAPVSRPPTTFTPPLPMKEAFSFEDTQEVEEDEEENEHQPRTSNPGPSPHMQGTRSMLRPEDANPPAEKRGGWKRGGRR